MQVEPKMMEKIDSSQLMALSCQLYLNREVAQMESLQLSGMYWLCRNIGGYWEPETVEIMEKRLLYLLREEVSLQLKLEKDVDIDVKEGLQNWRLTNIEVLKDYYTHDEALRSTSRSKSEILNLLDQCKHWDLPEKQRKWFHF